MFVCFIDLMNIKFYGTEIVDLQAVTRVLGVVKLTGIQYCLKL